ncbi:hypothetical protein V6582_05920 [Agrobacterium vitis]|uniref:hypothetical protein n=1 Tax=Agrobacterium vitis TaxID=373 RepID=UPI0012E706B8|nr:hypothetical protein [Agrobacterium vitis]MVA24556.1 hypothetical protein [Agrobacterium vitis]
MTVIFAGAFEDCAVIGGDQLRHEYFTLQPAGFASKVRRINDRVWGAKAGYGPTADRLWDDLTGLPGVEDMCIEELAAHTRTLGSKVYQGCLALLPVGAKDPGLYLFLAGVNANGLSSVHWLNFQLGDFGSAIGPGKAFAFGPDPSVHTQATALLQVQLTTQGRFAVAALDTWAISLTKYARQLAAHAVGFPTDLVLIIKDSPVKRCLLEEASPSDPAFTRCLFPL